MERNYKSKYLANGDITAAQFLTEFIMERIASKSKRVLPAKFWNHPNWNKDFRRQIGAANKLLAEFDIRDILAALRHQKGKWITSLGAKKQIAEVIKLTQKDLYTNIVMEQVQGESAAYEFCEEIPKECVTPKKAKSLWEKLQ
jgi:hypothetical protein